MVMAIDIPTQFEDLRTEVKSDADTPERRGWSMRTARIVGGFRVSIANGNGRNRRNINITTTATEMQIEERLLTWLGDVLR